MTDKPSDNSSFSSAFSSVGAAVLAANSGSDEAFEELVRMYTPMLEAEISRRVNGFGEQDLEDIRQEALLAFHRAVSTYDPLYGNVSFGLYAKVCVGNGIASACRAINGNNRLQVLPLDTPGLALSASISGPEEEIIRRESAEELRAKIRGALSPFENTVWWSHYSGMSSESIAEATGKSRKSVDNALCRVKKKLRELLK